MYHSGGTNLKRTTLADANRDRDAAAFSGLLEEMIALAHRKLRKQGLNITRFIGTSGNAVRAQVAVNMIPFLLLRLAQSAQSAITRPLEFLRAVRTTLMRRRSPRQPLQTATDTQRSKAGKTRFSGNIL